MELKNNFIQVNNHSGYLDFERSFGFGDVTHLLRVTFCKKQSGAPHCYTTTRLAFDPHGDVVAEIPLIPWEVGEELIGRRVDPDEIEG